MINLELINLKYFGKKAIVRIIKLRRINEMWRLHGIEQFNDYFCNLS